MSQPALTFLEKKWRGGYRNGNDSLIRASRQQIGRQMRPMLDNDTYRNISGYGRRLLMSLGRWLYWNVSAVRAAINETAALAVSTYIPQFEGEDQAWGVAAENWMYEHDKICNVRGWPYTMATLRRNLIVGTLVDGDQGIILAKTDEGYPMFQAVAAHRIGSPLAETEVTGGGPYDGRKIVDGVICGDQLEPIAYRILAGDSEDKDYIDVPARDMILDYDPCTCDMVRGVSLLGASIFDWEDASDARRFELLVQKLGASIGLIETNEAGEADKTKKLINRTSENYSTPTAGHQTNLSTTATETVDGVSVRYFRAGSNSSLEAYKNDRPTANQQAFRDDVLREALAGMGWSFDFSYNPTKAGGAQMRIVIDKINRRLEEIRSTLVEMPQRRMDGYRLSCAIQLKLLKPNVEWYKWSYQGPAELTADEKYSSDVDLQERKSGRKTLAKSAAQRGDYWKDLRQQKETETADLLERAGRLASKHKVSIEVALALLQDTSVYSTITNSASATGEATAAAQDAAPAPAPTNE